MKKLGLLWVILAGGCLFSAASFAETDRLRERAIRYDQDYPTVDYSGPARDNRVWRMLQKIESGDLKLEWEPRFGYLRSLLKALDIDLSTQTLVFSKTSLQTQHISEKTPRALYYNDDTYVGYVQNSDLMELTVVDDKLGTVFYGFHNRREASPLLDREGGRCLTCHDTYAMMGGGVPRVMVMSAPVDVPQDDRPLGSAATEVDDRTPIAQRWGGWYLSGWYLSGKDGKPVEQFGNLPLRTESRADEGATIRSLMSTRDNRGNVMGYFDTDHYLTDKSDVVALLVLEHQALVQNLITRVGFKVHSVFPEALTADEPLKRWADVDAKKQKELKPVIEPLIRAMFFADAVPLSGQVISSSGFPERFSRRGPRDADGRSLRDLKLQDHLFQYRLSYMIYTDSYESLPAYARDYIDLRVVEVLKGRDASIKLPAEESEAIAQILGATLPRFASLL
ncbi:MAG: hypothetical protein LBE59_00170 [Nevskiaceae bacterium]|jgi:hypothetical protein|nr:hypothetical protein [Nevskiaceae bacterium]